MGLLYIYKQYYFVCIIGLYLQLQVLLYNNIAFIHFELEIAPNWIKEFAANSQCLKITQNLAFGFLILAFSTNFCPTKSSLSGNTVWPQASGFQKLANIDNFWHF